MSLKSRADVLLGQAVAAGDVPGVVAMATNRQGTIYEGAFGKRALGQADAMTTDTVVWIASMTKALTGAGAMQLVERGLLDLDSPAKRWVPQLGRVQVLEGFDGAGQPRLRPPKRDITLRHLLTHTAGFSYEIWSEDIGRYQQNKGLPGIISCQDAALETPLLFDPGTRWEYGINIDMAGKAIEAVTGRRLGEHLKENLLGPLGMEDTGFVISDSMRSRLAKVHQRGEDGKLQPIEFEIPQQPEFDMGGGGMYGTCGDYLKFVRMVLNDGRVDDGTQVLRPETVQQMASNAMGDLKVTPLHTVMPPLSNSGEFLPGVPKNWGLSWQINIDPAPTGRAAGGLQWAGLANTFYWIDRTRGLGGVYCSQILPFADVKSLPLFTEFETTVYQTMT